MSLNITVRCADTAEASALKPVVFEIINDDNLPIAFKLITKHPLRYITNGSHGIVQPKRTRAIALRVRPPQELQEKENVQPVPASILKGKAASGSTSSGLVEGSATAEIVRIEIRVITGVVQDPATESDFIKYWPGGFQHSTHTIPFKVVLLAEEEYLNYMLRRLTEQLNEAECERAALQKKVDDGVASAKLIEERNMQFTKDLEKLQKRTAAAVLAQRMRECKCTVPLWIGLLATVAAGYSSIVASAY